MRVLKSPKSFQRAALGFRCEGKTIGFVPTMGALHEGHLSLIRRSLKRCDITAVSVFVNPTQFGPGEDFEKYPRPVEKDIEKCRQLGVDLLFLPTKEQMYSHNHRTSVVVEELSQVLCGRSRPAHFTGVTTVVAKLLNLAQCDMAFFGQKDAQQAVLVKRMAEDLDFPCKIITCPIVREKDGLALSSRNVYLAEKEREQASGLYRAIRTAEKMVRQGQLDAKKIISAVKKEIKKSPLARLDYAEVVDAETLRPVKSLKGKTGLLALAVFFGKTRLIDNTLLKGKK